MWWLTACSGSGPGSDGVPVEVVVAPGAACVERPPILLDGEPDRERFFTAQGLAVADLDGDGVEDLVVTGSTDTFTYRGAGDGAFEVVDWFPGDWPDSAGVTVADFDGDADLDVLLTRTLRAVALLRNDGGGRFVDVAAAAGLSDEPRRSIPSSWGDFDRDGDLDLWIGGFGEIDETDGDPAHVDFAPAEPDWLYVNQGDGTFVDASDRLPGALHDGYALAGGWHDVDDDGWLDLYPIFDFGQSYPAHLMWNRGGELVSDGGLAGLDVPATGMGLGAGDVNGDLLDDFLVPAWGSNWLLQSGETGRAWFDVARERGPHQDPSRGQKIAWGGELADLENDGDLDAFVTYGFLDARYPNTERQPDGVYRQGEDGAFRDVAPELGWNHPTAGRGSVLHDLDRDGALDWIRLDLAGPTRVDFGRCGGGSWLQLRLRQPGANPFAVGARVVATFDGGAVAGTVRAGGVNYASGGPPEVHLGLGDADRVAVLHVRWPDGQTSRLRDVDVDAMVTVRRE